MHRVRILVGVTTVAAVIVTYLWIRTHRYQALWLTQTTAREILELTATPGPFDSPGPEPCIGEAPQVRDSPQTLRAEKETLALMLPKGYRSFEISATHNNELRVVVPFQTTVAVGRYVPVERITEIWEGVLNGQRRDCQFAGLSVDFVTANGKGLLTSHVQK